MTYDAVDLFAGIGWGLALRKLGLTELGLDNDKNVLKLRNAHGLHTLQADLWALRPAQFGIPFIGLVGSPSCVKFSTAGLQEGVGLLAEIIAAIPKIAKGKSVPAVLPDMDPAAALVLAPLEWIVHFQPEWVALEQVKEVQPVWDAYVPVLQGMGYSVETGVLHAEQYGVPQARDRSILVANRVVEVHLPVPTHSRYHRRNPTQLDPGVKKWVSMAEGLGWDNQLVGFPRRDDGRPNGSIALGNENYRKRDLRPTTEPAHTVTEKVRSMRRFDLLPEWTFDRPSTTVVGSFRPEVIAAPGYRKPGDGPRQNAAGSVEVTLDEAAALQAFSQPVDWSVLAKTAAGRVIGNAVPGLLAEVTINAARGAS